LPFVVLSRTGRGWRGEGDGGCDLTIVQCETIQKCHNKSSPYNEYMLIKIYKKTEIRQGSEGPLSY
jgi:hypothetical protein